MKRENQYAYAAPVTMSPGRIHRLRETELACNPVVVLDDFVGKHFDTMIMDDITSFDGGPLRTLQVNHEWWPSNVVSNKRKSMRTKKKKQDPPLAVLSACMRSALDGLCSDVRQHLRRIGEMTMPASIPIEIAKGLSHAEGLREMAQRNYSEATAKPERKKRRKRRVKKLKAVKK